jgi:hypothetical protein
VHVHITVPDPGYFVVSTVVVVDGGLVLGVCSPQDGGAVVGDGVGGAVIVDNAAGVVLLTGGPSSQETLSLIGTPLYSQ